MLLQTLVENAIKHGIARRRDGGELAITARIHERMLELSVSNPPAAPASELPGVGAGVGLANATERLQLLFGHRATLRLDRTRPDRTIAEARIPIA